MSSGRYSGIHDNQLGADRISTHSALQRLCEQPVEQQKSLCIDGVLYLVSLHHKTTQDCNFSSWGNAVMVDLVHAYLEIVLGSH